MILKHDRFFILFFYITVNFGITMSLFQFMDFVDFINAKSFITSSLSKMLGGSSHFRDA